MAEFAITPKIEGYVTCRLSYAEARALAKMAEWDPGHVFKAVSSAVNESELKPYRDGFLLLMETAGAFIPSLRRLDEASAILSGRLVAITPDDLKRLRDTAASANGEDATDV